MYEGWLTLVSRSGKQGEKYYAFLLDNIFFLTQPVKSAIGNNDSFE